jgi:hypothetical protein
MSDAVGGFELRHDGFLPAMGIMDVKMWCNLASGSNP